MAKAARAEVRVAGAVDARPQSASRGIALFLAAMLLFAALDATAKHLAASFPVPLLVWARYSLHCLLMVVFLAPVQGTRLLATRRPLAQVLRGLMLLATTGFGVAALARMPLAEATAIAFAAPLFVTLLAGPVLGERIGLGRWAACLAGFGGVLLVAQPGADMPLAGVGLALAAAVAYSVYQLMTRELAGSERPLALLFYTALTGTVVMSAALPWIDPGPAPDARQMLLIASLGVYGGAGHFLMIRAFREAPASLLSPLQYVQLIWATALGYALFGHWPDAPALAGMAVIAAAGLWIALAGRKAGRG